MKELDDVIMIMKRELIMNKIKHNLELRWGIFCFGGDLLKPREWYILWCAVVVAILLLGG